MIQIALIYTVLIFLIHNLPENDVISNSLITVLRNFYFTVMFLHLLKESCSKMTNGSLLSYQTGGDPVELQLVKAAFRIANCFASHRLVRNLLENAGVSAKILRQNKIRVLFHDPYDSFDNDKAYAYSWIDPGRFGLYTVIFDSSLLTRYRTAIGVVGRGAKLAAKAAKVEMNWIELFVAIKLLHELAHLGFRWTSARLLVDDKTPPRINGGENGDHLERIAFGGFAGFVYRGSKDWNGSQKFLGIHIDHNFVQSAYMELICAECSKAKPDVYKLLPVSVVSQTSRCKRTDHIMSLPSKPSRTEIDALNACPHEIDLGNGCYLIPAGRCGIRYRRAQPRTLDFDACTPPSLPHHADGPHYA